MTEVRVVATPEDVRYISENYPRALNVLMRAIGNRLQKMVPGLISSKLGKYQTGQLAGTAKAWTSASGVYVSIGPAFDDDGHDYTQDVFMGARRHIIDQRAQGRTWPMRWSHAGGSGVAWRVEHPGQPARTDILDAIRELMYEVAEEEAIAVLTGLATGAI